MQAILRPWITEIKTGGYRSRHPCSTGAFFAGRALEAMKKRWSPSRTSVTVMCITTQRRNRPYAE
jgi:hypothetical protein